MKKKKTVSAERAEEIKNYKKMKSHHVRGVIFITGFVAVFCLVLGFVGREMKSTLREEQAMVEELQKQIDEQKELNDALEEKMDYVHSDSYYEELAREKLGLSNENDIIFKKQK